MPDPVSVTRRATAVLALLIAGCAPSLPEARAAWIRAAPDGSALGAAYVTISNGGEHDWIVDVESDAHRQAHLHETVLTNGISRMRARDRVELPPRSTLRFEPGGLHIMLMAPQRQLRVGDRVTLRFTLASGSVIETNAIVSREAP